MLEQRSPAQRRLQLGFTLIVTFAIGLTSCTKKKESKLQTPSADIFSNRAIGAIPDLYVVTLNSPALLIAGTKSASGWTIPEKAKQLVLEEQAAFEKRIQQISPDAKVLYRYRLVLNAVALFAPPELANQILGLPGVRSVNAARTIARPADLTPQGREEIGKVTSVNFIGAIEAHRRGFTGAGMRLGIIDTGIDYTHKMLGGSGDPKQFKSINPSLPSSLFPNQKVVGGIDLVGTTFDAAAVLPANRLPLPDANPLDEQGHGSHVGGTVAGIGDGVNTYSGVAPDASLYAIKVFGKDGSTADAVVIAAFEYSADPDGDLLPNDQLDVVNLSLGGGFGQPNILYSEAVRNLSRAGTFVVASAGNSGPIDYIVGAPSTADEALSVAASIDGSTQNWRFPAVKFNSISNPELLVKAVESSIAKPLAKISSVEGMLVDIGMADVDLTPEQKAAVAGNVAFIERGKVAFTEKLRRANEAGAIGVVVFNNAPGNPIVMGGTEADRIPVPAIMISQELGLQFRKELGLAEVRIEFKTDKVIEQPELIDTITDFSSKGPRSEDNLFKPEIAAPGYQILSASMGAGTKGIAFNGTSMSAPHMTGVMALLKQARPQLSSAELKSLVMTTAKVMQNSQGEIPLTLQGAGRVQVKEALDSVVISSPAAVSLGRLQVGETREVVRQISLRNLSTEPVELSIRTSATPGMQIELPGQVMIPANGQTELTAKFVVSLNNLQTFMFELDGQITFSKGDQVMLRVPVLAIRTQASKTRAEVNGQKITLTNQGPVTGLAMAFNLLGEDAEKPQSTPSTAWKSRACDLQSVGYRILRRTTPMGDIDSVQFAFKMYSPLTTWFFCEVSVLIDANGDGVAEQELAGVSGMGIEGLNRFPFASVVLNAPAARVLRLQLEKQIAAGNDKATVDYTPAVQSLAQMVPFPQSTVAVIEAPIAALQTTPEGKLNIKVAALASGGDAIEADDFLGSGFGSWTKIETRAEAQPYFGMAEYSPVPAGSAPLAFNKGAGEGKMVVYFPINQAGANGEDTQSQVLK